MKKKIFLAITLFCTMFTISLFNQGLVSIWAEEDVSVDTEQIDDLEDQIVEYKKKISELQGDEKTLSNEIEYMNSQISLAELQIQNSIYKIQRTEEEIERLDGDIEDLKVRIDKLENSINYQKEILSERMRERYKSKDDSLLTIFFGDSTLNRMIQKTEYLKAMELHDNKLLDEMKETKDIFNKQKGLFEEKKNEEEQLKAQLQQEKANLDSYKAELVNTQHEKESMLEQTKNDENKYQELLSQALAELNAIAGIVSNIDFGDGEKVEKGDIIAVMGNSGYPYCSTGAHLHFEIRKSGSVVNAEKYLERKTLYVYHYTTGFTEIGSGDWDWPMKNPTITQRYGKTPWSWRYPSGSHNGVDMTSSDTYIRAPEDGVAVKGGQNCYGAVINYVAIDHGDGIVSYYLHIK